MRNNRRNTRARLTQSFLLATQIATVLAITTVPANANIKQDARHVGHSLGSAAHDVGHKAKHVGLLIGHDAKKVGLAIGHAAKAGGIAFWHAAKGH